MLKKVEIDDSTIKRGNLLVKWNKGDAKI